MKLLLTSLLLGSIAAQDTSIWTVNPQGCATGVANVGATNQDFGNDSSSGRTGFSGTLADFATTFTVGGVELGAGEVLKLPPDGTAISLEVIPGELSVKGMLIRAEGSGVTLASTDTDLASAEDCEDLNDSMVSGLATDNTARDVLFTKDEAATATIASNTAQEDVAIDVTIIYENNDDRSFYAFDTFYVTFAATSAPSEIPSLMPSQVPSVSPTMVPSAKPSRGPTMSPSGAPSAAPTTSAAPTANPVCNVCDCEECFVSNFETEITLGSNTYTCKQAQEMGEAGLLTEDTCDETGTSDFTTTCGCIEPIGSEPTCVFCETSIDDTKLVEVPKELQPLVGGVGFLPCSTLLYGGLQGFIPAEYCFEQTFRVACGCDTEAPSMMPSPEPSMPPSTSVAPSAGPTTEAEGQDIDPTCFSLDTTVNVEGKGFLSMGRLEIGDSVQVADGSFEPIYSFCKKEFNQNSEFVQITAQGLDKPLEMTANHMLFMDHGAAVAAGDVKVGDRIAMTDVTLGEVLKIATVTRKGYVAPYTYSGTLLVNGGAVASVYATTEDGPLAEVSHWKHHLAHTHHRMLCRAAWFVCESETYESGMSSIFDMSMYLYKLWSSIGMANVVVMPILSLLRVLELVFANSAHVAVLVASAAWLKKVLSKTKTVA